MRRNLEFRYRLLANLPWIAMFYAVLLMIGLTNLALGYVIATYFGFGPKFDAEIDAARAEALANQPRFSIIGGGDETPIDELPPAQPLERTVA